jgi:hypothetical protein
MEADSDQQDQIPQSSNNFRISSSSSSNPIYCKGQLFKKFKHENVIKMKNKPDPALVGGSYLFNEIKKRTIKSRETIPLKTQYNEIAHECAFICRIPGSFTAFKSKRRKAQYLHL